MESHHDINLQQLRQFIIRYGAKCMERFESDLFYDCQKVEKMQEGDVVYWMVSDAHTHTLSQKEIDEKKLLVEDVWGNRCNYKITCMKIHPYRDGEKEYLSFNMERMQDIRTLRKAANNYHNELR